MRDGFEDRDHCRKKYIMSGLCILYAMLATFISPCITIEIDPLFKKVGWSTNYPSIDLSNILKKINGFLP